MADNEKYYYIKLKDSYFDQDNIKVLESMKNGHIYSLIIIKLYLKASKTDGQLMMTQRIPYDPNNVNILANVIGHDVDHVKEAIRLGIDLDLIKVIEGREIWMTEIQNMIGQSSTEADRIRSYRKKLDEKLLPESTDVQMYDKSTPEIEKEIERETDTEKSKKQNPEYAESFTRFWKAYPRKEAKGNAEKAWKKIDISLLSVILEAIECQKATTQSQEANGKYIPLPASWLNARRWEDEVGSKTAPPKTDYMKGIKEV